MSAFHLHLDLFPAPYPGSSRFRPSSVAQHQPSARGQLAQREPQTLLLLLADCPAAANQEPLAPTLTKDPTNGKADVSV